jgi:4-alpha-glucanotransferase
VDAFVARHPTWIGEWAAFAGEGAVADQVRFEREWSALKTYANERGVGLVGDLPIYVAENGADHLAHPELFVDDVVAGVPPDAFTDDGQRWGNPIYDWSAMRATGFRWWIERFRRTFELHDLVRVDHFRGFVAYWAVPAEAETAKDGTWRPGPGRQLFDAVEAELGELPLIAEDLGVITEPVVRLRDELGLPGMHVLQFGFDDDPNNPHRPQAHRENGVVYTGTHDNDTARGWWDSLSRDERERTGLDPADPAWSLLELAWSSPARLAIVPAQDLLGLGSEARMNVPGRERGNWRWRLDDGRLTEDLAARLRASTEAARR